MNTLDRYNDAVFAWQYEYGEQGSNHGDIEYYKKKLKGVKDRVLELGCGTGRITLPLKQAGVNMVGLDQANAMIKIAHKKAVKKKLKIPFIVGDAVTFKSHSPFGVIIFPYNSLSQIAEKDVPAFIRHLRTYLKPGGRFLFDIGRSIPGKLHGSMTTVKDWTEPLYIKELGVTVRRQSSMTRRPEKYLMDVKYHWEILHKNRRIEKRKTSMQFSIRPAEWYVEQLEKQGFKLIEHIVHEEQHGKTKKRHSFVELVYP